MIENTTSYNYLNKLRTRQLERKRRKSRRRYSNRHRQETAL
jgi:hypothetical protein